MEYIAPQPTKEYKVLIKCFTYNQEKYIEDALKGFVRQKTNFPFCALVVDDCSTDSTAEIIKQYELDYPDIIKGIYLPVNMYGNPEKQNYIKPWEERAQYIAYCEGDDYWIDDYKLQRQVDFLDTHPEYMMHFHNAIIRYDNHTIPDRIMSNFISGDFDTKLIFDRWQLPLASIMFKREILDSKIYNDLIKIRRFGVCYFIAASCLGRVYGLSECLSVYRKSDGGVSNIIPSSSFVTAEYEYAKLIGDPAILRIMNRRMINVLYPLMPRIIKLDKAALKIVKTMFNYSYYPFFIAILKFIINVPILQYKHTFHKNKQNETCILQY